MANGRFANTNLFEIKVVKMFLVALGTFSTKVGSTVFATTGFTEEHAKKADIDYIVGTYEAVDRHPAKL